MARSAIQCPVTRYFVLRAGWQPAVVVSQCWLLQQLSSAPHQFSCALQSPAPRGVARVGMRRSQVQAGACSTSSAGTPDQAQSVAKMQDDDVHTGLQELRAPPGGRPQLEQQRGEALSWPWPGPELGLAKLPDGGRTRSFHRGSLVACMQSGVCIAVGLCLVPTRCVERFPRLHTPAAPGPVMHGAHQLAPAHPPLPMDSLQLA